MMTDIVPDPQSAGDLESGRHHGAPGHGVANAQHINYRYLEVERQILQWLNQPDNFQQVIRRILRALKTLTDVDSIGIRLQSSRNRPDFPYHGINEGFDDAACVREMPGLDQTPDIPSSGTVGTANTNGDSLTERSTTLAPPLSRTECDPSEIPNPLLDDNSLDDVSLPCNPVLRENGVFSFSIPIRAGEHTVGLLQFSDRQEKRFPPAILERLELMATHIGATYIRRQAEKELMERENLLQKVFDVLPIGLWFADKHGKLLRGNPAGIKIWGKEMLVATDEYGAFKARRLPSGEDLAPEDWALMRTIRDKATVIDELLEIEAFDGHKKIILNSTAPVLDDRGNLQGAIVMNQDITDRQRTEQRLHAQMHELERWHDATLGREGRIIELKREVNALLEKTGQPRRYNLNDDLTESS